MVIDYAIRSECPRCSCAETWDHFVKCKAMMQTRKKFAKELLLELQKAKLDNMDNAETLSFIEDVLR